MTLFEIDTTVFRFLNIYHTPLLDQINLLIHYGTRGGIVYYPFAIGLLLSRNARLKKFAQLCILSGAATFIFTDLILKNIFGRLRPYQVLDNIHYLPPAPDSFSFPSGQAGTAFAIAMLIILMFPQKRIRYAVIMFAIIVGLSRIYMGHHYPSDVLGGAIVGIIVSFAVWKLEITHKIHEKTK